MSSFVEAWQEVECPIQQSDMDLDAKDMVYVGQSFYCCLCGSLHIAGASTIETFATLSDGTQAFPDNPTSQRELDGLRAQIK